jgi:hypothetical protein
MSCISKQDQIDRLLTHVGRYQNVYNDWFQYYKPSNVSLSAINPNQISIQPYSSTIEFEGLQTNFYNFARTSFNSFGKNYYNISTGYTFSNGLALSSTGRQTSIELHPEFFKLKTRSLTAFWVDSNQIGEWRVPLNLSGSNSQPILQVTQGGTGPAFRVNDVASDTTPFIIDTSGNVGIGTASPSVKLDVVGRIRTEGTGTGIIFNSDGGAANNKIWYNLVDADSIYWQAVNDAGAGGGNLFKMVRSGNTVQSFQGVQAGNGWFTISNENKRVGINTIDPNEALTVSGNISAIGTQVIAANTSTNALRITQIGSGNALLIEDSASTDSTPFVVNNDGNVGIAVSSPTQKLDIDGTMRSRITDGVVMLGGNETSVNTPAGNGFRIAYKPTAIGANQDALIFEKTDNDSTLPNGGILFANIAGQNGTVDGTSYTAGDRVPVLYIKGDNRVGIGTTSPVSKLDVVGNINTSGNYRINNTQVVKGRITGWGTPSGTISRNALTLVAAATYNQNDFNTVIETLKALITDLRDHGLIGT